MAVVARSIAVSLDGYMAGPDQDADHPLGVGGPRLHEWVFATRTGREMIGEAGGDTGIDDELFARGFEGVGATLMGRNMFGPVRGPWGDSDWRGWWGPEPPYHHPVFVLTHHARPQLAVGETTFHFGTDGLESGLRQAVAAAGPLDVRVGGGAQTLQQLLRARRLDELHVAIVPVLLGAGERLFDGLGVGGVDDVDGYECVRLVASPAVAHVVLRRTSG